MNIQVVKITEIKSNPNNPRVIKDEKFHKLCESIKAFPKMLELRPIVVNDDMVVLGGNMRLKALRHLGLKEAPIIKASDLTNDQQRQFIIKDNAGFGQWDWNVLANDWNTQEIEEWGIDIPGFDVNSDELGEEFSLADGEKMPFQQMTFKLADEQAEQIQNALSDIKMTNEYKYAETFGNENSNGNALYLLIMQWAEQKK